MNTLFKYLKKNDEPKTIEKEIQIIENNQIPFTISARRRRYRCRFSYEDYAA